MKKTLLSLLLVAFALSSCSVFQRSQLDTARSRWQAASITHYRYKLFVGCFCAFGQQMPLHIEVRSGKVTSMQYRDGTPLTDEDQRLFASYAPIDTMFDFTAGDIGRVDSIKIDYDPKYGFPTRVALDPIKNAMDDELSLTVSDFEPLP